MADIRVLPLPGAGLTTALLQGANTAITEPEATEFWVFGACTLDFTLDMGGGVVEGWASACRWGRRWCSEGGRRSCPCHGLWGVDHPPGFECSGGRRDWLHAQQHSCATATLPLLAGYGLAFGGLAQLLAGMWEFKRQNTFGATAFSSYGERLAPSVKGKGGVGSMDAGRCNSAGISPCPTCRLGCGPRNAFCEPPPPSPLAPSFRGPAGHRIPVL